MIFLIIKPPWLAGPSWGPGTAIIAWANLHGLGKYRRGSIPPLGDQPASLIFQHLELLDRLLDRALLIELIADDPDQLGRRALEVVDGPGMQIVVWLVASPSVLQ